MNPNYLYLESSLPFQNKPKCTISLKGNRSYKFEASYPPSCGGFSFKHNERFSDRYIIWKSNRNILEIFEYSLRQTFTKNFIRIQFDGEIVPNVIIREIKYDDGQEDVILKVVTRDVSLMSSTENKISLHVFNFPHPNSSNRVNLESKSIFYFIESNFTNFFSINDISDGKNFPTSVCGIDNHSIAIGFKNSQILIIDLQSNGYTHKEYVLEDSSSLLKIFDYFKSENENPVASMASEEVIVSRGRGIIYDYYLFALFGNDVLRVYSVYKKALLLKLPLNLKTTQKGGEKKAIKILRHDESRFTLSIIVEEEKGTSCLVFDGKFDLSGEVELTFAFTSQYPNKNIVDSQLSSSKGETLLWNLWRGVDSNPLLMVTPASIKRQNILDVNLWKECILDTPEPNESLLLNEFDIEQKYLDMIFQPGRFNSEIIFQALCWITNTKYTSTGMSYSNLKIFVQNEMKKVDDENKWETFLEKCKAYWRRENDIIGFYNPKNNSNLMFLIRKNGISVMRKGSYSEYISILISRLSKHNFYTLKTIDNDYYYLLYCMSLLENELSQNSKEEFNSRLYQLEDPFQCALDIVTKLTQNRMIGNSFSLFIKHSLFPLLKNISDFSNAIEFVLKHINPLHYLEKENTKKYPLCKFYDSYAMRNIISQSVTEIHQSNFRILKNLLFVIALVKAYRHLLEPYRFDIQKVVSLTKDVSRKTKYYFSTIWLFSQRVNQIPQQSNEVISKTKVKILNSENILQIYYTLFQQNFVNIFEDEEHIRSYLHATQALSSDNNWESLLPFILSFSSLIYPETEYHVEYEFIFAMIKQNHISLMQSYLRLIDSNTSYHQYLLGECYLRSNEFTKAIDCFTKSGILYHRKSDKRIEELISKFTGDYRKEPTITEFWLYILNVINEYNNPDIILRMSKIFLSFSSSEVLWSNVFNSAIKLGKCDIAYIALISIPDSDVQRDCLSTFITNLIEAGHTKQLLNYPFIGLQRIVDQILIEKANISNSLIYYELLYSINIHWNNYGKAATALYECSLMYKNESQYDDKLLRKRANYLLATINVLKLLKPENAWILTRKSGKTRKLFNSNSTSDQEESADYELVSLETIEKMYNNIKKELKLSPSALKK